MLDYLESARRAHTDQSSGWSFSKGQNLEVKHVCKCTCFTTNTTLIPLQQAPKGRDLCSTCTKQFCVDKIEACRGAQIIESNDDSSTGFEGQVWAKCFGAYALTVRDPTKDQTIVSLYLLCLFFLLFWAFLRSRHGQTFFDAVPRTLRQLFRR